MKTQETKVKWKRLKKISAFSKVLLCNYEQMRQENYYSNSVLRYDSDCTMKCKQNCILHLKICTIIRNQGNEQQLTSFVKPMIHVSKMSCHKVLNDAPAATKTKQVCLKAHPVLAQVSETEEATQESVVVLRSLQKSHKSPMFLHGHKSL